MKHDITRYYSAINADELKAGDKVIVADTLDGLKHKIQEDKELLVRQVQIMWEYHSILELRLKREGV